MNNNKLKRILCAIIACLTLVSCSSMIACEEKNVDGEFTYKTDITEIKPILNTTNKKYRVLVNKENAVDESYDPGKIVEIDPSYTNGGKQVEIEENVKVAVEAMIDEMKAEGIEGICVTSGYRSYAYQEWLFNTYIQNEKEKDPSLSDKEAEQKVLAYSARPGTSEHHTGLCVDLWVSPVMRELENFGYEGSYDDVGFAETEAFEWLKENAHKFGFILRYPEDKVGVTRYSYESWHYRFVGVGAANVIYKKGITLEEYLEEYADK